MEPEEAGAGFGFERMEARGVRKALGAFVEEGELGSALQKIAQGLVHPGGILEDAALGFGAGRHPSCIGRSRPPVNSEPGSQVLRGVGR